MFIPYTYSNDRNMLAYHTITTSERLKYGNLPDDNLTYTSAMECKSKTGRG